MILMYRLPDYINNRYKCVCLLGVTLTANSEKKHSRLACQINVFTELFLDKPLGGSLKSFKCAFF